MTEHEWLSACTPIEMLNFARAGPRKLRLFACACCRSVLNEFAPGVAERTLVAAELFADGDIKPDTLEHVIHTLAASANAAHRDAMRIGSGYLSHLFDACRFACYVGDPGVMCQNAALHAARAAADFPLIGAERVESIELRAECAAQCELLRCIVGNPFAPVAFDATWRTSDAVALAQSMYESRDFTAMPILADALQEAGCDNEQVLAHCRDARDHARGCWVCDTLLGKV